MQDRQKRIYRSSLFTLRSSLDQGFTLIELVIVITILAVLALGTIPLVQNAVRRQKEQQLRETLREIRLAIDEFKRDANGPCTANQGGGGGQFGGQPSPQANQQFGGQQQGISDPRQRVMISDCKIFEASDFNPDRYPPTLEVLVEGVEVLPRVQQGGAMTSGGAFGENATDRAKLQSSEATEPKKKVYLRELPVDPITGKSDWKLRSPYQEKDSEWDNNSVFDVRSAAEGETLDGVKYGDL